MKKVFLILLAFSLLAAMSISGDKKSFEGEMEYIIDYHAAPGVVKIPDGFTVFIKETKMRIDVTAPFGSIHTIIDSKNQNVIKLYFIAGEKYVVKSTEKSVKNNKAEIVFDTKDVKEFNGYHCKKALIKNGDETRTIYYTEEINVSPSLYDIPSDLTYHLTGTHKQMRNKFIIQSETVEPNETTTLSMKSLKERSLDDSEFQYNEKDFTPVTSSEIGKIIQENFKR
jgi:hypothetical protein